MGILPTLPLMSTSPCLMAPASLQDGREAWVLSGRVHTSGRVLPVHPFVHVCLTILETLRPASPRNYFPPQLWSRKPGILLSRAHGHTAHAQVHTHMWQPQAVRAAEPAGLCCQARHSNYTTATLCGSGSLHPPDMGDTGLWQVRVPPTLLWPFRPGAAEAGNMCGLGGPPLAWSNLGGSQTQLRPPWRPLLRMQTQARRP